MLRRDILKRTGAAVTVGALAGCLSQGSSPGGSGPDDGSGNESTTTTKETTQPKPTLQNRSLTVVNAGCASGTADESSVAFKESKNKLVVRGTVQTSDPCYVAKLGKVNYDRDAETIDITVQAKKKKGVGACQQCLGAIEYESTFVFDSGVPKSVTVSHRRDDEKKKKVTTAEHASASSSEGT
ncbi:hypothetical protein [Haladaptatus caseinilyticus]|uniref:hypothetical protein n=1 Tax=Haladaptatus caseinilyticus TaxID=2993314 RepID=UPI00224A592D|nr:hypothetical protein [Haladaptatus caseinilyticus]